MKKEFSKAWKKSSQPRKQRKYRINAPLHIISKFMHSHLSKDLRTKYQRRAFRVIVGDRVKICRGQFKNIEGKVDKVNLKKAKIYVAKAEMNKKDGSKSFYPIDPSNVIITELLLDDKQRLKKLQSKVQAKK